MGKIIRITEEIRSAFDNERWAITDTNTPHEGVIAQILRATKPGRRRFVRLRPNTKTIRDNA